MKYCGNIGFANTVEKSPGKWVEEITEHPYYGDILRKSSRIDDSGYINEDINYSIEISIVADQYARNNIYQMRYAVIDGIKWKINNVDPTSPPRLLLSIGGVYNDGV